MKNIADLGLMGLAAMAAALLGSASAPVSCSDSSECLQAYWEVARLVGHLEQGCPSAAVPTGESVRLYQHVSDFKLLLGTEALIMTPNGTICLSCFFNK